MGEGARAAEHPTVTVERGRLSERAARRFLRRARTGVGLLVLSLSLISPACASRTTTPASQAGSRLSFVIGTHSLAGLPIALETPYRRALHYFAHAGQHGSSSFPDGLCELKLEKIGLALTFYTPAAETATPATCTFFMMAVVTGSRWHTANGLRVGAPLKSLRRLFPRAYNSGKISGKHRGIPTGSTDWWLANHESAVHGTSHAARPVLDAYVRGGRVVALGIIIVGH